jgi:phosphoglycerol transferase MdoB-like AlkP superfamily enzyme
MKSFFQRIVFNLSYLIAWLAYFFMARLIFLAYYYNQTSELDLGTIFLIPLYGLKLDLSFSSYISALPFLFIAFSIWIPKGFLKGFLKAFSGFAIFLITFLFLFDLALYGVWGVRLDSTPLMYLNTPKQLFSSITTGTLVLAVSLWIFLSVLSIWLFSKLINRRLIWEVDKKIWQILPLLLMAGMLVLTMRGGLQTIPINQSNVYFSDNMYANHAAVNYAWNFTKSLGYKEYDMKNPYILLDSAEATQVFQSNTQPLKTGLPDSIQVFNTEKPNVILIIWESLTAKLVETIGGEKGVTPNLNRLAKEGIQFSNFYANGDRSDKGLVAILSGYPSQTNKSIIKSPNKTRTLPMFTQEMANLGYENSYFHGGDLNFGNMNTYLRNGKINHFVEGSDFDKKDWNSKWGAHDHVVLDKLLKDTPNGSTNFFKTIFTLSSHEPYEFPADYKFGKDTDENLFRSAHHYTDESIGKFIAEAKQHDWWKNTIVIIVADHGHSLPRHEGAFNSPKKFQIPMVWIGGALAMRDTTISTISSQSDLPFTLLSLVGGDNSEFNWSKNLFNQSPNNYAHYIFNKGFGIVTKSGTYVYDYVSNKPIMEEGNPTEKDIKLGKAIGQKSFQDFLERK